MGTVKRRKLPFEGSLEARVDYVYTNDKDSTRNRTYHPYARDSNESLRPYLSGSQFTESESHPGWTSLQKGRYTGDLGGPFFTTKTYFTCPNGLSKILTGTIRYGNFNEEQQVWDFQGPIFAVHPSTTGFPLDESASDEDLDELGTTAIARCSPSNPTADLSVALGEVLKEGIPSLVGGTLQQLKSLSGQERRQALGKEYLNVEFGWKPFINDLVRTATSIVQANDILEQYERDSGRLVRRSYDFPVQESDRVIATLGNVSPYLHPSVGEYYDNAHIGEGTVIVIQKITRRQWFRGAFSYYVPPPDTMRHDIARQVIQARKLLGISLTPDTLWNLAPWSWAVDWFFNVGDVLSNWTDWAIDNQVLMYGYMMDHTIVTNTYTFTGPTGLKPAAQRPSDLVFTRESKKRRKATPYGFGLTFDSLSDRQKTIIAALGISRSK
nr:MAG: hypothetical protein 1 [Leviviridae sp.]